MEANKAETPEDEREISLNETSLKKSLDPIDVVGGHGPWQFRQWVVLFAATLCNATVLFSALFLPAQMYCFYENATGTHEEQLILEVNGTSRSTKSLNYVRRNGSHLDINCNSTDCKTDADDSINNVPASEFMFNKKCSNSEIEIYAKCIYVIACALTALLVYLTTNRFGRRPLTQISCLFLVASSLGSSWSGSPAVFLILRFIASLGVVCIYLISAFSLMEYVHKDFKFLYFFTGHLGWGVAHFFLSAGAWVTKDWMLFNIVISIVCVLLSLFVWLGPESPASFPSGGEQTRIRKALKYAAYVNGYSTTDVDLLSHNFRQQQENKSDLGTLASSKAKIFLYLIYSSVLFIISFTTTLLYFATKWHTEWFRISSHRINFSFLGTTDIAATIILLFLTCIVPVKYLWACVSVTSSSLLIIIFSRNNKEGNSKSSAVLYIVTVFFASAAWTLVLARSICYKISSTIAKLNLFVTASAVFTGALVASAIVLRVDDRSSLIILAIPHLISSIAVIFLPDDYFGGVS